MIYVIIILIWCIAFANSPVVTLVMTGLICLAVFPTRRGNKSKGTGSISSASTSPDCMTTEELEKYTIMRKAADKMGDWDGSPVTGMEDYYKEQLKGMFKEDSDTPELRRMQEDLKALVDRNRKIEDTKMEEKDDREKKLQQIIEKARRSAKMASKIAKKE